MLRPRVKTILRCVSCTFAGVLLFVLLVFASGNGQAKDLTSGCDKPGWFPEDFGLKDHYVFWHDGYYYLISIYVPPGNTSPWVQDRFVYGRSTDFCQWEDLSPVLPDRVPGTWDEQAIWAPFVYQEDDVFYLYYTGVTEKGTQSIMLATSLDPSDPEAWETQGMQFQPDHDGMHWKEGIWADCRDPMVIKIEDTYYLYYSGKDTSGGIIGLATGASPAGPWTDQGAVVGPQPGNVLESPTLTHYGDRYYLFYSLSGVGAYDLIGSGPTGPWGTPLPFGPGWAHEVWQDTQGSWYSSYLTDLTVTISPLTWDTFFSPPHPRIGSSVYHQLFPLVLYSE